MSKSSSRKGIKEIKNFDTRATNLIEQYVERLKNELNNYTSQEQREEFLIQRIISLKNELIERDRKQFEVETSSPRNTSSTSTDSEASPNVSRSSESRAKAKEKLTVAGSGSRYGGSTFPIGATSPSTKTDSVPASSTQPSTTLSSGSSKSKSSKSSGSSSKPSNSFEFEELSQKRYPYPFDKPDSSSNVLFEDEEPEREKEDEKKREREKASSERADKTSGSAGEGEGKRYSSTDKLTAAYSTTPKTIQAATLEKLVEKLTLKGVEEETMKAFILGFRVNSIPPQEVFCLLLGRYGGPDKSREHHVLTNWMREKEHIQHSVLKFIKLWLENIPSVLRLKVYVRTPTSSSLSASPLKTQAVSVVHATPSPSSIVGMSEVEVTLLEELSCFLTNIRTGLSTRLEVIYHQILSTLNRVNKLPLERSTFISDIKVKEQLNFTKMNSERVTPDIFALQITLIEHEMMCKIEPEEFLKQRWNKDGKETKAPNLFATINWFNKMTHLLSTVILKELTPEARSSIISNLIHIAAKCKEHNNYNTIMEILACLHSPPISWLKQSWGLVNHKLLETFEELGKLMSPKSNYKFYREALSKTKSPFVPYLGVFLTDFTFMDDCKQDEIDGLLNFDKIRSFGETLSHLFTFRELTYAGHTQVMQFKEWLMEAEVWDDNYVYTISKLREDGSELPNQKARKSKHSQQKYFENLEVSGPQGVSTIQEDLSERDWKLLLTSAATHSYRKDQVIMEQDNFNPYLYRIREGTVRIEKIFDPNKPPVFLKQMHKGAMFGEMSVLDKLGKTTARVVCDDDLVEIDQIELKFVHKIFETQPGLAKRFFKNLAVMLAKRTRESAARVSQNHVPGAPLTPTQNSTPLTPPSSTSSPVSGPVAAIQMADRGRSRSLDTASSLSEIQRETKLVKKLGAENEIIIKEYSCSLKAKMTYNGSLFVMQKSVSFYAKLFGREIKERIELIHIKSIDSKGPQEIFIVTSDPKKNLLLRFKSEKDEAYNFINSIWKKAVETQTQKQKDKDKDKDRERDKKKGNLKSPSTGSVSGDTNQHQDVVSSLHQNNSSSALPALPIPSHAPHHHGYVSAPAVTNGSNENGSSVSTAASNVTSASEPEEEEYIPSEDPLTKEDWEILLKGARTVVNKKDEMIITEGQSYQRLYQINKGSCRISKMGKSLGMMNATEMFGEISFLEGTGAAASVIANEDEVELSIIEGYYINILFEMKPGFAGRFFHHLCTILAGRLKKMKS